MPVWPLCFLALLTKCTFPGRWFGSVSQAPRRRLLPRARKLQPAEVPAHAKPVSTSFLECNLVILLQDDIVVTFNSSKKKQTQKTKNKREGRVVKAKQCVCSLLRWSFPADPQQSFSSCSVEAVSCLASTQDESKTSEQDTLYRVKIKIHFLTASIFTNAAANHGLRDPQHH